MQERRKKEIKIYWIRSVCIYISEEFKYSTPVIRIKTYKQQLT